MERLFITALMLLSLFTRPIRGEEREPNINYHPNNEQMEKRSIKLTIGDKTFTATLEENVSAKALKRLLADGDLTVEMKDYANMEKVGPLGTSLPRSDKHITVGAGDLILYQGNQFVIYYDSNTWTFTRLGKIDKITKDELKSVLGSKNVIVTLSSN